MDINQYLPWIALAVTVATLAILWVRTRPGDAGEALAQVQEATEISRRLVAAAQQLWTTGRLPRDERFDWVARRLAEYYPDMDANQAAVTIEAAVYWLKHGLARAAAAKSTTTASTGASVATGATKSTTSTTKSAAPAARGADR